MSTLTLYRGDAEKIREFSFHKTNKHCLFGPGIYLTNKQKVADSYRTKGGRSHSLYSTTLFSGHAKDRTEALVMLRDSIDNPTPKPQPDTQASGT